MAPSVKRVRCGSTCKRLTDTSVERRITTRSSRPNAGRLAWRLELGKDVREYVTCHSSESITETLDRALVERVPDFPTAACIDTRGAEV